MLNNSTCPQCGTSIQDASIQFCPSCRFPVMRLAGKYRLESILERGGFSILYHATHTSLSQGAERVIKVLNAATLDDEALVRFQREVELTMLLSQENDHIVRIFDDFGMEPQLGYYYVMEYMSGYSLKHFLPNNEPLNRELTFHIFQQICTALHAAHRKGIVHRDLKPGNIFLVEREGDPMFVKLLDFGIARLISDSSDPQVTQRAIGTPIYMSPEQCLNRPVDERSDVYAIGVLLYLMLTGTIPFEEDNLHGSMLPLMQAHVSTPPRSMRQARAGLNIPVGLEEVVLQAICKQPSDRFPTAKAFWEALEPYAPKALSSETLALFKRDALQAANQDEPMEAIPEMPIRTKEPATYSTMRLNVDDLIDGDFEEFFEGEEPFASSTEHPTRLPLMVEDAPTKPGVVSPLQSRDSSLSLPPPQEEVELPRPPMVGYGEKNEPSHQETLMFGDLDLSSVALEEEAAQASSVDAFEAAHSTPMEELHALNALPEHAAAHQESFQISLGADMVDVGKTMEVDYSSILDDEDFEEEDEGPGQGTRIDNRIPPEIMATKSKPARPETVMFEEGNPFADAFASQPPHRPETMMFGDRPIELDSKKATAETLHLGLAQEWPEEELGGGEGLKRPETVLFGESPLQGASAVGRPETAMFTSAEELIASSEGPLRPETVMFESSPVGEMDPKEEPKRPETVMFGERPEAFEEVFGLGPGESTEKKTLSSPNKGKFGGHQETLNIREPTSIPPPSASSPPPFVEGGSKPPETIDFRPPEVRSTKPSSPPPSKAPEKASHFLMEDDEETSSIALWVEDETKTKAKETSAAVHNTQTGSSSRFEERNTSSSKDNMEQKKEMAEVAKEKKEKAVVLQKNAGWGKMAPYLILAVALLMMLVGLMNAC